MHLYVKKTDRQKLHQSSKALTEVVGYIGSLDWNCNKKSKRTQTTPGGLADKLNTSNNIRPVSIGNGMLHKPSNTVLLILLFYYLPGFIESSDSRL